MAFGYVQAYVDVDVDDLFDYSRLLCTLSDICRFMTFFTHMDNGYSNGMTFNWQLHAVRAVKVISYLQTVSIILTRY